MKQILTALLLILAFNLWAEDFPRDSIDDMEETVPSDSSSESDLAAVLGRIDALLAQKEKIFLSSGTYTPDEIVLPSYVYSEEDFKADFDESVLPDLSIGHLTLLDVENPPKSAQTLFPLRLLSEEETTDALRALFAAMAMRQDRLSVSFTDGSVHVPFYTAEILDTQGNEFFFTGLNYKDPSGDPKYFFLAKRGIPGGEATFQLDFNNIRSIYFIDYASTDIMGYTKAQVALTSGDVLTLYINTEGFLEGYDTTVGAYASLYVNYNVVKEILFFHEGAYKRSVSSGIIYYDDRLETSPFDGTPLISESSETNPLRIERTLSTSW